MKRESTFLTWDFPSEDIINTNMNYGTPPPISDHHREEYSQRHKSTPATMSKRAVLIGCNYPGTKAELKGCIHDVQRMHRSLLDRYKFPAENITVLIDTDSSYVQPTGQNIRSALSDLVAAANPGDILFVHYSGHGTRLPAEDDETGYDECIVPTDMNLITDDDFREFVDKVPEKCIITIVSDSCHSGGLINAAKEQIGESTQRNKTGLRFFKNISATAADACSDTSPNSASSSAPSCCHHPAQIHHKDRTKE